MLRKMISAVVVMSSVQVARAECDFSSMIGYTILAEKRVSAYIEDGVKKDGYEGCRYDRILVFSDNTGVKCSSYHYHYSYMPKAIILSNGSQLKACIDGEEVDVRLLP